MSINCFLQLVIFACFLEKSQSCYNLFKKSDIQGTWDMKEYKRNTGNCKCGLDYDRNKMSWTVYIHVTNVENQYTSVCMGSIITSNLIATSHSCLTKRGRRISWMDMWGRSFSNNMASLDDIRVLSDIYENSNTKEIPIDDIIFHPNYVDSISRKRFPHDDVALLRIQQSSNWIKVISGDSSCSGDFCPKPVCIPMHSESKKLFYQYGYYYGIADEESNPMGENIVSRGSGRTLILPSSECDKKLKGEVQMTNSDTVCVKFRIPAPDREGGSLLTYSEENDAAFLTGIASWVGDHGQFSSAGEKYAYFSHIKSLVKYIEWQAEKHKSVWCTQSKMQIPSPTLPEADDEVTHYDEYKYVREESLNCGCGHSNVGFSSPSGRVVGGKDATPYEFGWMVKLQYLDNSNDTYTCTGSLINDRMILTAGHCVYDKDTDELVLAEKFIPALKAHNFNETSNEIKVSVSKVIPHPDYLPSLSNNLFDFDVALLILSKPVELLTAGNQKSDSVVPICLPKADKPVHFVNTTATIAGWGNTDLTSNIPHKVLQKLNKTIMPLKACRRRTWTPLSSNVICFSINSTTDSAPGDSGGPLMILKPIDGNSGNKASKNWHWFQVGLCSNNAKDITDTTGKNEIGLYMNLQSFLPFIHFHAKKHGAKWCKLEGG